MADPDPLAAALERIGERTADVRAAYATGFGGNAAARESAEDVPRLLAAVEAAIASASRWKRFAAPGDAQDECADDLRQAITRELLGEE